MPNIDNKSNTQVLALYNADLTADGITYTGSIETAHYDNGVTFVPILAAGDGATTVTVTNIQDSEDNVIFTNIPSEKIIGDLANLVYATPVASGDEVPSIGVISTNAYLRLELTTSTYTNNASLLITVNAGVEVAPANS